MGMDEDTGVTPAIFNMTSEKQDGGGSEIGAKAEHIV